MKQKENIRKATYRRLPMEEKRHLYLESRSTKQKLLDWVGSKSRELVRVAGTVDAWAGPAVRNPLRLGNVGNEVKLLGSGGTGYVRTGMSDRAKRVMVFGMVVGMGGLMGWCAFGFMEKTRAEGPVEMSSTDIQDKVVSFLEENRDRKPGVFVWGSNRYSYTR